MSKTQWKQIGVGAATLALLTLLMFWVFRDSWQEILYNIRAVRPGGLFLLLGMGTVYQLFEAATCMVLIRGQFSKFSFRQAVEVTFLGVFANVSTLSVGVVPMQSWYLYRQGMLVGSGAGVMTLEYALHKSSVLLYTTLLLIVQRRWFQESRTGLSRYLLLGYLICAVIIAALILLCTWNRAQRLAKWGISRLPDTGKWGQRKDVWERNLSALYRQSRNLMQDRKRLGTALLLNALKLLCLYSVPFVCAQALYVPALSFWRMNLLAALMHLISNALPNVAGVGPVEFAFMMIFPHFMGYAEASSALILYRVATFFFPFLLSVFVFLAVSKEGFSRTHQENK